MDFPAKSIVVGLDKYLLRSSGKLNVLAVCVGVIAGYGAIGFRFLIGFFQNLFMHNKLNWQPASPLNHVHESWVIVVPAIGLLIVAYMVRWLAREAKGHGVPEVVEAVLARGGRIRKRVVAIKALASSITIAVGGSVGREGPIVQIGSAAGSALGQLFHLQSKQLKILVGCGASGAIAATFNTPIAGVIFAVELIVLEWRASSFTPLVISSVFATVISRLHLGNDPAFIVPDYAFANPRELVFYLGLAILAGVVGALTIRTLYGIEDLFDKAPLPFFLKPVLGGLLLGWAGYHYPEIFGTGYEAISSVLLQDATFQLMLILVFLKILMMSVTLGAGGSGGIFAPSLFIGAMLGGAYGTVVNHYFPEISAGYGAYALVGMAAVFAATSSAVFTAIVILFEMTLDYPIILPLMFVCVIANQVSRMIVKGDTIYSIKLARKGLSFIKEFGVSILAVTHIKEIMSQHPDVLYDDMTLSQAQKAISNSSHMIYPVISKGNAFVGLARSTNINYQILIKGPNAKLVDFLEASPKIVSANDTILKTLKNVDKNRDPRIVVVDKKTHKLLGIVSPTDFIRLISREMD